jgi:hypothetical protein
MNQGTMWTLLMKKSAVANLMQVHVKESVSPELTGVSTNLGIKDIVQRDLTGVETRLKKCVLLSYSVGKFSF